GVGAAAEGELGDDGRVEDVHPVGRAPVVRVEVVRADAPAVDAVRTVGPAGGAEPLVVRSPPLRLEVDAVLVARLEVEADEIAVLGRVLAQLVDVGVGGAGGRPAGRGGRGAGVQQRQPAPVDARGGDDVPR